MTPGGTLLLDGQAAELEFTRANVISAHMTPDGGLLSGLRVNGQPVPPAGAQIPVAGGRLSALFDVRDTLAVEAQAQLDSVARDLIERFQDPVVDPTLPRASRGCSPNWVSLSPVR